MRASGKIVIDRSEVRYSANHEASANSRGSKINYKNVMADYEIYPKVKKILDADGQMDS